MRHGPPLYDMDAALELACSRIVWTSLQGGACCVRVSDDVVKRRAAAGDGEHPGCDPLTAAPPCPLYCCCGSGVGNTRGNSNAHNRPQYGTAVPPHETKARALLFFFFTQSLSLYAHICRHTHTHTHTHVATPRPIPTNQLSCAHTYRSQGFDSSPPPSPPNR